MSKFTLDEAIKHCLEVAERQEISADDKEMYSEMLGEDYKGFEEGCQECAAEHRQLAEWLTELKDLKEEYANLNKISYGFYKELKKAKRLLKSAIDEWNIVCEWGNCGEYCGWWENGRCSQEWSGKDEALKLIGEE